MTKPKRKRQTADWWNKRRTEYVQGAETIKELAQRYDADAT